MFGQRFTRWRQGRRAKRALLDPEEVLLDASNLPSFDVSQFEGRVERSIGGHVPMIAGVLATLVFSVFVWQAWNLQVAKGEAMALLSEQNSLRHEIIFAGRGVVYDRHGRELAWNEPDVPADGSEGAKGAASEATDGYAKRAYIRDDGFAHVLGFIGYPEKDTSGVWWRTEYAGKAGVERSFNIRLAGENGVRLIEVDALGNVQSQNTIRTPEDGENITLAIDADIQAAFFDAVKSGAERSGFVAGAGAIMDVKTGEVLALVSFPEYDPQVMTDGTDTEKIAGFASNSRQPFLNRAVLGEYTPGSIVKPYIAAAALAERIVTATQSFLSTGAISIPNPYYPGQESVFRDWKAHGFVDMREALAVSSNVYFYIVGGGYEGQQGLGIRRLSEYAHSFGLGEQTGIETVAEAEGLVPTPEWKKRVFGEDDPWRIGNTYHTAIGQFGFLMTPIQASRYIAAVANGGYLVTPTLERGKQPVSADIGIANEDLAVVREGMRRSVQGGIANSLNVAGISIAAKTGTAQLGERNQFMNSWVVGFWPVENPRFAFAAVLEKAPANTLVGAAPALSPFFSWLAQHESEYARGEYPTKE